MSSCRFCDRGDERASHEHCRQCSRGFRSRTALFNHLREYGHFDDDEHPPPKPASPEPEPEYSYQCAACSAGFNSRNKLFAHIRESGHSADAPPKPPSPVAASAQAQKMPTCEVCFNVFGSRNALFAHIRKTGHDSAPTAIPPPPPPLPLPQQQYAYMPATGQAQKMPTCEVCYDVFGSRNALFKHIRKTGHDSMPAPVQQQQQAYTPGTAQANRMPTCEICYDVFSSRNRLFAHIAEKHPNNNNNNNNNEAPPQQRHAPVQTAPNQCKQCRIQFPSRNKLMQHVRQEEHYGEAEDDTVEEPANDDIDVQSISDVVEETKESADNDLRCKNCFREFKSRNRLFAHIREMDHYEEAKEPPKNQCIQCRRTFPSRNRLFKHINDAGHGGDDQRADNDYSDIEVDSNLSLSSDEDDYDELIEEVYEEYEQDILDGYTPQVFQAWDPFPDCDAYYDDHDGELDGYIAEFNATADWDEKYRITVEKIMKPFLDHGRPRFTDWPEKEIRQIFDDAQALPMLPSDDTRYICHEFKNEAYSDKHVCDHEDECWCYFEASPGAGIPGLHKPGRSIRKDRRACISFMHNLLIQLLIVLSEAELDNWDYDEKWLLFSAIKWTNPARNDEDEDEDNDDDDDERWQYLTYDSNFTRLAMGKYDEEGEGERTKNDPQLLRLCGSIGRRMLALGVCRVGDGHYFPKKQPMHYWNVSGLMSDDKNKDALQEAQEAEAEEQRKKREMDQANVHFKRSPRVNVDQPRYPTRVINTHTYEFEEDTVLYQGSYAILSHTWIQRGREVTFDTVEDVFAEAKEEQLLARIKKIDANISQVKGNEQEGMRLEKEELERDLYEIQSARKRKQQEKEDKKLKSKEGSGPINQFDKTTSGRVKQDAVAAVQAHDPGKSKLLKSISEARVQGLNYIWVDSCCINKSNNTELVEAISSMGDWYKNAKVCLVYIDDFDGTDLTSDRSHKKATKNRYATRGWTLQEIVMSPHAIFYNKSWKIIADTKDPNAPREKLARICRIPPNLLCCGGVPNVGASIILQLATRRRTFKPEDRAYALMGMLGVRIRADYGEGQSKAVSRLFEAIIRTTSDVSIFNWSGKYASSSDPGRSMYPTDFDGYEHITDLSGYDPDSDDEFDYPSSEDVKPARALGAINLDHFGVHAKFDICEMGVVIEQDNEHALATVRALKKRLLDEPAGLTVTGTAVGPANTYCSCQCEFSLPDCKELDVEVLVPVSTLEEYLEFLVHSPHKGSVSKWVMARFAGVKNANWFLCDIRMKDTNSGEGLFADVLQSGAAGVRDIGNFMHYLESSGFPARRIAMTWASQQQFPVNRKHIKSAYLWVG